MSKPFVPERVSDTVDKHCDYAGWLIQPKNSKTLYVQGELPPYSDYVLGWTSDERKALGFKKKADAIAFLERLNIEVDSVTLVFVHWRRA